MVIRRTSHTVYDTQYHLVWAPKYRRDVLRGDVQQRVKELFADIAIQYDISIDEMEVSPDHVHIFCSFPPRYSISQVVTRFKSLRRFPAKNLPFQEVGAGLIKMSYLGNSESLFNRASTASIAALPRVMPFSYTLRLRSTTG